MRISDKIKSNQSKLVALKSELAEHTKSLESDENNMDIMNDMDSVMNEIDVMEKSTSILLKTEKISSEKAVAVVTTPSELVTETKNSDIIDFFVKSALVKFESVYTGVSVQESIEKRYGTENYIKSANSFMRTKGQQDPAFTSVDAWAGALVQDGFGAFIEMISTNSIVGQLPLETYTFDGYNSIKLGKRKSRYPTDKNLAGAFVGEGQPIRVGAAVLGSITLTPKKIGIIGTFSSELFRRSTPNIETSIRKWMQEDTALMVDTIFLGTGAGTSETPAGIRNGITAIPSTGSTIDKIDTDAEAAMAAMETSGAGSAMHWVMSNSTRRKLGALRTATGPLAYPEIANGLFKGSPIASSTTAPSDMLYLIDTDSFAIAGGTPQFLHSNVATIHEEYVQADVKPIVGAGTGTAGATDLADIANPVRSFFQTDTQGVRMTEEMDWNSLRDGSVQVITGLWA